MKNNRLIILSNWWAKLIVGLALGVISLTAYPDCPKGIVLYSFLANVFGTYVIWSGSELIATWVGMRFSWEHEPMRITIWLIVMNIFYILTVLLGIFEAMALLSGIPFSSSFFYNSLFISVSITLLINLIYLVNDLYKYWKTSMYEAEVLRKENMRSQLESLKNQVNPHFLFNSLNTLVSIIDEDTRIAKEFVLKLSQVYRYILQAKDQDMVSLQEEMNFMESYNYLLQIRYGENLRFHIRISSHSHTSSIPTLVLQMLVENAIKHNIISAEKPLDVTIATENDDHLVISNHLQLKNIQVESNKVGLKNIADRYKLLGGHEIKIIQTETDFIVKLPLIH